MADSLPTNAELDALIDAALRDEPLLPTPPGLHRKIQERVLFAALQERERTRFRNTLLSAVGALVVLLAGTATIVTVTHFSLFYHHGVSGGMGLVDYYLNRFDVSWSSQVGTYALLLTLGLSTLSLWAGFILFRTQMHLTPFHTTVLRWTTGGATMRQAR
jgi:hypothetical protein